MSKIVNKLCIVIAAKFDRMEAVGFWLGCLIPPTSQVVYGATFPAPYFVAIALIVVNFAKIFVEFFEKRINERDSRQAGRDNTNPPWLHLKAGLALSRSLGLFSIGLGLAGLLTYGFIFVRIHQ